MKKKTLQSRPPHPVDMYDQKIWWRTAGGEWVRVADMAPDHCRNTAAYLLRHAEAIAVRQGFRELVVYGDAPDDVVDSWMRRDAMRLDDPRGWITSTRLYRALIKRARKIGEQA